MSFENISKGEFTAQLIDMEDYGIAAVSSESKVLAQLSYGDKLTDTHKADTEFIAYCFNLQQRYDISKLEEAVDLFERLLDQNMCSVAADDEIEQLLKQIKK